MVCRKIGTNKSLLIVQTIWIFCILFFRNSEGNAIQMPAMARKAGGSWKPELVKVQQPVNITDNTKTAILSGEHKSEEDEESYEYEDSYSTEEYSSEELRCPRGMYYFTRSKMCVPNQCIGGNKYRMIDGSCAIQNYAKYIKDYAMERRLYPGRFQPTYSNAPYVYRNRGPVSTQTRHMTFFGKKKGPFTG